MVIATFFVLLTYGSYKTSHTSQHRPFLPRLSNGTLSFGLIIILLSLDGFRANFFYRNFTFTLNFFIANGISSKYMLLSFSSVTFPNHYILVIGLYIETHELWAIAFGMMILARSFTTSI